MTNDLDQTRTELVVEQSRIQHRPRKKTDFSRRALEGAAQVSAAARATSSGAGAIPLLPSSCSSPLAFAPRANITHIDNDITAWFAKDDPVYRDYERFRDEFGGSRTLIIALKADSADRLFSRADARLHPAASAATSSASTPSSASPASRRATTVDADPPAGRRRRHRRPPADRAAAARRRRTTSGGAR